MRESILGDIVIKCISLCWKDISMISQKSVLVSYNSTKPHVAKLHTGNDFEFVYGVFFFSHSPYFPNLVASYKLFMTFTAFPDREMIH